LGAKVRFLGVLKDSQPRSDESGVWHVPEGMTVQDIVDQSRLMDGKWEFYITVNGEAVLRGYRLTDGDEVVFSTLFLGG